MAVNSGTGPVTMGFQWRGLLQLGSLGADPPMVSTLTRPSVGTGKSVHCGTMPLRIFPKPNLKLTHTRFNHCVLEGETAHQTLVTKND